MGIRKIAKVTQRVDVDKNPTELPGESLYDKETQEAQKKLLSKMKRKHKSRKCHLGA